MTIGGSDVKLTKTPFLATDMSNILNEYLKEDHRIPEDTIRFSVCENDAGNPQVSLELCELASPDENYQEYFKIACEIFDKNKDKAVLELVKSQSN